MNHKRRSPEAATSRLLESRKKIAPLSGFRSNFNPNQAIPKPDPLSVYTEALEQARRDSSRENLLLWKAALKALPRHTL